MLKGVADYLTPVLHSSQFISTGVLTPEEFTSSGDQLVHTVRTWKWEAGPPSASKPYLQPNKQYLITRNVPCLCRANAYEMQVDQHCGAQPLSRCVTLAEPRPAIYCVRSFRVRVKSWWRSGEEETTTTAGCLLTQAEKVTPGG